VLEQVASGMAWEAIIDEWRGALTKEAIAELTEKYGKFKKSKGRYTHHITRTQTHSAQTLSGWQLT
jgi:hypothetical protein